MPRHYFLEALYCAGSSLVPTDFCRCMETLFCVQVAFLVSLLFGLASDPWQIMPQKALVSKKESAASSGAKEPEWHKHLREDWSLLWDRLQIADPRSWSSLVQCAKVSLLLSSH